MCKNIWPTYLNPSFAAASRSVFVALTHAHECCQVYGGLLHLLLLRVRLSACCHAEKSLCAPLSSPVPRLPTAFPANSTAPPPSDQGKGVRHGGHSKPPNFRDCPSNGRTQRNPMRPPSLFHSFSLFNSHLRRLSAVCHLDRGPHFAPRLYS